MMFGQSVLVHTFITVADEEGNRKGIGDVTGGDTLALRQRRRYRSQSDGEEQIEV